MRHCVSESLDKRIKKLTEGCDDCCCDTKYSIMNDIDDDACLCEPEAVEVIEDDFIIEAKEDRMSSEEARNLARKEAYEIGLTGPGYTSYVNRRSRELIMGEDVPEDAPVMEEEFEEDIASDAADAVADGCLKEEVITEAAWQKELETGPALRRAIESKDPEEAANALVDCYDEILMMEDMDEDVRDACYIALDNLKPLFLDGERGAIDYDGYDEEDVNNFLDNCLDDFYNICDEAKIWVSLEEALEGNSTTRIYEAFESEYKEDDWDPEDIELHKSIDWKARNWEDYPVEGSDIDGEATLYHWGKEPEKVPVKMKKYIRPNSIFPPYYRAENSPFEKRRNVVGSMYDGHKHGKYGIHDRYEDQQTYNMMSEQLKESDIMKYNSVGKMLHDHMGEIDLEADEATLKRQLIGLLNNYQSEISDKKGLVKARELFTKLKGPRLYSTVGTYMTGDKVTEDVVEEKMTAGDKFRAFMKRH